MRLFLEDSTSSAKRERDGAKNECKTPPSTLPPPPPPPNPQLRFSVRRDCGPCMPRSRYVLLCNLSHPKLAYQRAAPPTSEGEKKMEGGMQQKIQRQHPPPLHPPSSPKHTLHSPSAHLPHSNAHTCCFK